MTFHTDLTTWPWQRLAVVAFALAGVTLVTTVLLQRSPGPTVAPAGSAGDATASPHPPLGTAGGAAPAAAPATTSAAAPHELGPEQIQGMAQRLAERLARQPDDADGWAMLARTQALSGQHAKAVDAFRKAEKLRPTDPVLLADFADALAMTQQRSLAGEPLRLVQRALKLDPQNLKALSLAGTEAFDRKDYAGAVKLWETLQAAGGPDSVFVQQVQGGIAEARQLGGMAPAAANPPASALGSGIKVKISRGPGP